MARKDSDKSTPAPHGLNDVIGIALMATALLLMIALLSYDPYDLYNRVPANVSIHNYGGPLGAFIALALFQIFGVAAYIVPALLLVFGLGNIFQFLAYLRHRRTWACVLLLCCMGLLSTYENKISVLSYTRESLATVSVGGFIGKFLHLYILQYLGTVGATIVLGALYLISLLYLTNFQLGAFCRQWWDAKFSSTPGLAPTAGEKELENRARDLQKQARKLQEQIEKKGDIEEKSGLGVDGLPVPEPTVRDLSVPQSKTTGKSKMFGIFGSDKPADAEEGEVITAREIAAASTADILGKNSVLPAKTEENKEEAPVKPIETESVSAAAVAAGPKPKLQPRKPKGVAVTAPLQISNYQLPSLDFLQYPDTTAKPTESKEELMANAKLMQQTLAQFDIDVALGDITKGPTITRYELHPAPNVKLDRIAALNNNIAAVLKAERINILAPVPGRNSVGIEVPNPVKTKVIIRDLFETEEWKNTKCHLPLALGKDVYGNPIIADLADMPHLLIAGSTGSGKSVCLNSIIASLLYKLGPDKLRFVMIDPKVVEMQQYNTLPHLVVPVVSDPQKAILALRWAVNEMEKRYQIFAKVGVRNLTSFNSRPKDKPIPQAEPELPLMVKKEKVEAGSDGFAVELDEEIVVPRDEEIPIPDYLSHIVVIIDELADLMLEAPADVETAIARLTAKARAAGIHCIVATQRPSVKVITGIIKANIPSRIAFQVVQSVDSRVILDRLGAEKLLGKGDMLYLPPGTAKLIRAQGVLVTDQEILNIVNFISSQAKPSYVMDIHEKLEKTPSSYGGDGESECDEDEGLIQQCIEVIRSEQKASVSLMQRRLRLGYTRAARIMDELENRGIVGPSKGAEPRDILIDLDGGGADGAGVNTGT